MFPLWTIVTLFRPFSSAYFTARRINLFVPVGEIGLIPTPESQRICFFPSFNISLFRKSSNFFTSGVPLFHSMPMYTSSVFSRKITTSIFSGSRTGAGTPVKYRTGLTHTYKSRICRSATFNERIPPPTGVVSGPLMLTRKSRAASTVSSGSHCLNVLNAFSPANTSNHATRRFPPYAFSTAASNTRREAFQISRPVPSPSINGMIGRSGTCSTPPLYPIAFPSLGTATPLYAVFILQSPYHRPLRHSPANQKPYHTPAPPRNPPPFSSPYSLRNSLLLSPLPRYISPMPPSPTVAPIAPASVSNPNRLMSLDVYRGLAVAGMIIVDNPG